MDLFIFIEKPLKEKETSFMKRIGNLFEKIVSLDNIKLAIIEASRNKRNRKEVRTVFDNIDFFVPLIQEMLINKTFKNSEVIHRTRIEKLNGKVREISVLPFFPDQIIHHALMRVLEPVMKRGMYYYCCANVKGRGEKHIRVNISYALKHDFKHTKYCLKMDIKKYYPSISTSMLKNKLRRVIKDKNALWLLDTIIDIQEKGLPLGTYTSQWLANFYLQDADHFIKEKLQASYYYRYADDLVILGSNKRKLRKMKDAIVDYLKQESLEIKDSWRIFKVDEENDIDFVGYRFFRKKISIRKRIFKNIRRCLIRIRWKIDSHKRVIRHEIRRLASYYGYIKNSDSVIIMNKYMQFIPFNALKKGI